MEAVRFWEYKLTAEMLCLGERIKKATFRPTLLTIPSTQATGAIRAATQREDLWAIGCLDDDYLRNPLIERKVYAPRDKGTDVSKLPLEMELLRDVRGRLFVRAAGDTPPFPRLNIALGAFRSVGIGRAALTLNGRPVSMEMAEGELKSRIPEEDGALIGIEQVMKPLYGYLFKPTAPTDEYSLSGHYVRALLEKSIVKAYAFIVNPRKG
jgi:hypothetical protein